MPFPKITTKNVRFISGLELGIENGTWDKWTSRPVWLVTLRDQTKLVVKSEAVQRDVQVDTKNVKWTGKLMHKVSDPVKTEPLGADEVAALNNLNVLCFAGSGAQVGKACKDYLAVVISDPSSTMNKMKYVENLTNLESLAKKKKAEDLLNKMKTVPKVLESLGAIIATDMFTGNSDRFNLSGPMLGRVRNQGNVLFTKDAQGDFTAVGLDWYEAQGEHSDMQRPPKADWYGQILNNDGQLDLFATNAIASLNEIFATACGLTPVDLISSAGYVRLRRGINNGRNTLRTYLVDRLQNKGLPAGIKARMDKLGWTPPSRPGSATPAPAKKPAAANWTSARPTPGQRQ